MRSATRKEREHFESDELDYETKDIVISTICEKFEMTTEEVLQSWKNDKMQMKEDWRYVIDNYVPDFS